MLRKENIVPNEFYHVYNRGNSKQKIFHDKEDYERFMKLLYICNGDQKVVLKDLRDDVYALKRTRPIVLINAYCIMPNHFHLLITSTVEEGISTFMKKVSTGYAMYYNAKYSRTGSLFEGRFKAKHIKTNTQLRYLFSYIHLNPVKLIEPLWKKLGIRDKKKVLSFLEKYKYSSFQEYMHIQRRQCSIVDIKHFDHFLSEKNFIQELLTWLSYNEEIY